MSKSIGAELIVNPEKYYNISQLRTQFWNELKKKSFKLNRVKHGDAHEDQLKSEIASLTKNLKVIEQYWAFPGLDTFDYLNGCIKNEEYRNLYNTISEVTRLLISDGYRSNPFTSQQLISAKKSKRKSEAISAEKRRYFEVLMVDNLNDSEEAELKQKLFDIRDPKDKFIYQLVVVRTFEDALIALQFNHNIQACVVRYGIQFKSKHANGWLKQFITSIDQWDFSDRMESELAKLLGETIKEIRPELDTYYVTDTGIQLIPDSVMENFKRIFYRKEDLQELHLSIIQGLMDRYQTPFFSALKEYSKKPTGVFHAMPISRGNSIFKSNWIDDFGEFYGRNIFLAETSSTTGGLDSLLQPTGPLKKAQELAAQAFGSQHTFFVTNGTSTSNKIVLQALVEPGDIILIDRDCHKSHHYGMVLSGSTVAYLDSYPLEDFSMYGAVPLEVIKEKLWALKKANRLDKVKMLLLTNCTFDGLVYNVERVMEEILAIKPDMVFLWDEAWFGFAAFTHIYKQRTGMNVARRLAHKYSSDEYAIEYERHITKLGKDEIPLMPNPERVRIRVYATQSTHKTLSSMRQGSMIHIYDQDFKRKSEASFHEAYMTHTSTSPNYQILASLDAGRRQVSFEGFELVEKSIDLAMTLRAKINDHPKLKKYFKVLTVEDLIPKKFRLSGLTQYYDPRVGWSRLEGAWSTDEFVLDPTKINLHIGNTGVDGDTFKNQYLMDQFNIQINKTSRNSVLFMTNIGTTRSSVSYLLGVLLKISSQLDDKVRSMNPEELRIHQGKVHSLTNETPPLPDFSYFHDSFRAVPGVPGGDLREAYFLAYKEEYCEYLKLMECRKRMDEGRVIVSSSFVIPYPPGFPILVPGQVMTEDILNFFVALDVKEIHGYRPDLGLRIFNEKALNRQKASSAMGSAMSMGALGTNGKTSRSKSKRKTKTTK
ncbi:MAG: aminotransferase class I/II-fold pyridoxal phosphate-dependent enzyme [Cyclobacteriaceae bacterium]